MSLRVSIACVAVALLWSVPGYTACSPKQTHACGPQSINLSGVPQISEQIAGQGQLTPAPKLPVPDETTAPYNGPTVGLSDRVRRAPTVGYRWALQ